MIKFFRKIRQQLVSENKFSKYLLYAIGEIVLVVIGIFIALQLNTWKENKEKSDLGYSYLIEMRNEVQQDIIELEKYLKKINEWTKEHEDALNTTNIDKLSLDNLYSILLPINTDFEINEVTHTKIKNLGLTSLSKNEVLNAHITNYYNVHLPLLKRSLAYSNYSIRKHLDYFAYEQDEIELVEAFEEHQFPILYEQSVEDFKSEQRSAIITFIKSNKGRIMTMEDLKNKRYTIQRVNDFKEKTYDFLESIDSELKAHN